MSGETESMLIAAFFILAAYLIEECEKLPRPKTQKELAERTQVAEPNISRWLKACGLDFQRGVIVRRTVS